MTEDREVMGMMPSVAGDIDLYESRACDPDCRRDIIAACGEAARHAVPGKAVAVGFFNAGHFVECARVEVERDEPGQDSIENWAGWAGVCSNLGIRALLSESSAVTAAAMVFWLEPDFAAEFNKEAARSGGPVISVTWGWQLAAHLGRKEAADYRLQLQTYWSPGTDDTNPKFLSGRILTAVAEGPISIRENGTFGLEIHETLAMAASGNRACRKASTALVRSLMKDACDSYGAEEERALQHLLDVGVPPAQIGRLRPTVFRRIFLTEDGGGLQHSLHFGEYFSGMVAGDVEAVANRAFADARRLGADALLFTRGGPAELVNFGLPREIDAGATFCVYLQPQTPYLLVQEEDGRSAFGSIVSGHWLGMDGSPS